jgi:uncharacterized protein YjcR
MIDVDTFYKINHLYHGGHLRLGQIAEQLHLDVETVSKWIQRDRHISSKDRAKTQQQIGCLQSVYYKSFTKSSLEQHKDP